MEQMTQNQLETLHSKTMREIQMYVDGLVTLPEFIQAINVIGDAINTRVIADLIDPASGLRMVDRLGVES